ncbi:MAG: hydroxymethylglutaryl-CoA lyase [Acidobacteriota bacterium]
MSPAAPRGLPSALPDSVSVIEVGPRDGFQMEELFIPTELKVEAIERLADAGLRAVEAVSFAHPRVIPQMRDAGEVLERITRRSDVEYTALVPNLRGAERALAAGVDGLHFVVCASETYNQRNVGMSVDESVADLVRIARTVDGKVPLAVTMAVTFGCPFEGQLPDDVLVELAARLVDAGADHLGLADTAGLGDPMLVRRVVSQVQQRLPATPLRMHLHDTRGLGIANALTAMELGVGTFDTALGGLGGCPVMRGASGNVSTEDFVNLCDEMGLETGVDVAGVAAVSRLLQSFLGRELPSKVLRSGTRDELYAANRD